MARLVLTDTSPVIALSRINGLGWFYIMMGQVAIPRQVAREIMQGSGNLPGERNLVEAIDSGWLKIIYSADDGPTFAQAGDGLASCLRLAISTPDSLLITDDRYGRAIAMENHVKVAGTASLIGMAKRREFINSARRAFSDLHDAQFRISQSAIKEILEQVCEAV